MADPKSVFVSYSWDSEDHKVWVRTLAERLVSNGVHAYLDDWDVQYGESLTQFMEEKLPTADFVFIVCTPQYATKSTARKGGVGYEAQIISSHIAASIERSKFVPILRTGKLAPDDPDCAMPPHFRGIRAIDMRADDQFDTMFENLLRHVYGKPALTRPSLGKPPSYVLGHTESLPMIDLVRLANFEIEHWELQSGVVRNELHPETFEIPSEATRRSLAVDDVVKLMFEYRYPEGFDEDIVPGGERMWVKIVGLNGPYFIGRLNNSPVCTADWHDLDYDSQVVFLPEHVIDFDKGGKDSAVAIAAHEKADRKKSTKKHTEVERRTGNRTRVKK